MIQLGESVLYNIQRELKRAAFKYYTPLGTALIQLEV